MSWHSDPDARGQLAELVRWTAYGCGSEDQAASATSNGVGAPMHNGLSPFESPVLSNCSGRKARLLEHAAGSWSIDTVSCPGQLWGNRVATEALFKPSISPSTLCVPGGGRGTACPAYRQAGREVEPPAGVMVWLLASPIGQARHCSPRLGLTCFQRVQSLDKLGV
jgi:hypothetical protein